MPNESTLKKQIDSLSIPELASFVGELMAQYKLSLTCAESCTGGGIAYAITAISGSSSWFERSWVTYSNTAKQQMLGVEEQTILEHGAVSSTVVEQMAQGALVNANANIAVSVSGIAGPGGGSLVKPVGLVWFAIADNCFASTSKEQSLSDSRVCSIHQQFSGDRASVREQAIQFGLRLVARKLVESGK